MKKHGAIQGTIGSMGKHQLAIYQKGDVRDEPIITSEAEMYIISSMAGRSLGNGNRF